MFVRMQDKIKISKKYVFSVSQVNLMSLEVAWSVLIHNYDDD